MDKTEREYIVYGGAGLVALIFVMLMLRNNSTSGTVAAPSSSQLNFMLKNTEDANANALAMSQLSAQSILGYVSAKNNLELGLQQIQAEVSINKTNADSAQQIAQIEADANAKVAQLANDAAKQISANQQSAAEWLGYYQAQGQIQSANAASSASQTNSWTNLLGNVLMGLGL